MHRNTIYFSFHAKHIAESMMKGKIMDRVAAVQQGPINIKKVGIRRVPTEAGANKGPGQGLGLISGIWNQSCHLELDSRRPAIVSRILRAQARQTTERLSTTIRLKGSALANNSLVQQRSRFFTPYGTPAAIAELANIQFQFSNGSAQRIAVHAQFARRLALVAFVLLKNVDDEALLEFTNRLRVQDAA